ncbi:transcription-repair coupling factor [Lutibaculum baratangense]|uniref:Transcription-repair-coupling factor n=1 Tax=Lutibaculum baratangense AMV1 TaxID=631454 RepID=V4R3Q4_9HYPH|nr:transcription-repair coupling factor [Lutibaculum baratangense]ESR26582.1 Transcription-repair coupling factor [Lutibaculum baratangense AMV1]
MNAPTRVKSFDPRMLRGTGHVTLAHVAEGFDAVTVADAARALATGDSPLPLVFVARDAQRLAAFRQTLQFFAPGHRFLSLPAWDCLPYDRVSPAPEILSERLATLANLATADFQTPTIVGTTVNALIQRVPTRDWIGHQSLVVRPGNMLDMTSLAEWLGRNGFERSGTVRERGEFAVRGGIVDLFAPGHEAPLRLDFFGDTLESIRPFDPETQRSTGQLRELSLVPMSELTLDEESVKRFRQNFVARFGVARSDDALYTAVSERRRHQGMEHWLPFFHERMATVFDYLPGAPVMLDALLEEARAERMSQIRDYHQARVQAQENTKGEAPYKPLDPHELYLSDDDWKACLSERAHVSLTPFDVPETEATGPVFDMGSKEARSFAAERTAADASLFQAVIDHDRALNRSGKRVIVACWSEGSRDRMGDMLRDHGLTAIENVDSWDAAQALGKGMTGLAIFGIERGFEAPSLAVIGEQDVLGERYLRAKRKSRKGADFLTEVTSLSPDDYVVHVDHGIGRFVGLKTIEVTGAPHDCLEIHYHGGDKLFLPVENIELLSRYGSEDTVVQLDRLGGGGWQARKAKMKERIREMANALIKVAAARAMRDAPRLDPPEGAYDEFCARFPYEETDDQLNAIDAVLEDFHAGKPMDRLICGDVGFGKTEVALRAAFVAAMSGRQVAVVVPTTLLARQHYKTFSERFRGFPINVAQVSRMVSQKEAAAAKRGIESGEVDILVGTHALLSKSIKFRDLALLIVDEEQHFGVAHKERLKELRADVHVLTLTATPIPRTLQLSLTGIRELSIIATPPVDRLAVRTFVTPFDGVVLREALLREHYRGGQTYFVAPRLSDLPDIEEFLKEQVPEVKYAIAHGQLSSSRLEEVMTAFYDGQFDVLVSTAIVESGLDVPTANTLIVHRADMFGLAQLYQMRGRVGRSKARAYAYFAVPGGKKLTKGAEKRLKVLQSLDTLGAGFMLASHDLDIRGAGNLLGEEQSGHIKEVGYELYQSMLEEAVASLREGGGPVEEDGQWSPQIELGTPVLIPEHYVTDLEVRLGLYRRLSQIEDASEVDAFGSEMADRFGRPPSEVEHLLDIVRIKILCREAGVERVEAGPKGMLFALRNNRFANPNGLVDFVSKEGRLAKVRPDHKIVLQRSWESPEERLRGAMQVMRTLAGLAQKAAA